VNPVGATPRGGATLGDGGASARGASARGVAAWLDGSGPGGPPLAGDRRADVVVIGAGFTGLWTALALTERDPSLDVVVLEAAVVGHGASGRNGGFVDPSLTHGIHNGLAHFPGEIDDLVRLGAENLAELTGFVRQHAIDCHLDLVGAIDVATEPWQLAELEESVAILERAAERATLLDAEAMRKEVDSPTYLGGLARPDGGGLVDPGALVRGLARVALERGVTIHEGSPVVDLRAAGSGVRAATPGGQVRAERAVLATNAYSHRLLPRLGRWFVPVYDHVLLTAPLTPEQLGRIGWEGRQGLADTANQFHYYRLTPDDRILWGGYDAIYRYGSQVGPRYDHRRATYDLLARNFRRTFPQLDDVPFERWWGGPIATTTRFTVTFGDTLGGRAVWALGYTGLGVATSRFAARVLTDKLLDPSSPLLDLRFTSTRPVPFPPEPLRWAGVALTRRAIQRADAREGRRGPWLALLDRFGIGFDS
jgi:glycine/D-amino acid oxidase-like deaminating enzyme